MKLSLSLAHKKKVPKKKFRIDARRYWVILLCGFVLALAGELVYFSFLFLETGERIAAPASATLETNDIKIKRMQTKLREIDAAIKDRID